MMKAWITQQGLTVGSVAAELGVTRETLSRWIHGRLDIPLRFAAAIERLTDGAVPVSAWVRPSDEEAAA